MGLPVYILLLLAFLTGTSSAISYVPLSKFITVGNQLNSLAGDSVCTDLRDIRQSLDDITNAGLRPKVTEDFCPGESSYTSFCSILDGTEMAPMVGSTVPKLCSAILKINSCYEGMCPTGRSYLRNAPKNACPTKAIADCLSPVKHLNDVDESSCSSTVPEAINCYRERLLDCGGTGEQQLGADIILSGLAQHIKECEARKYSVVSESAGDADGDKFVPFVRYREIAEILYSINKISACSQLLDIKQKLEGIISITDKSTSVCQDEDLSSYCSILTNAMGAPMAGDTTPTICKSYGTISACLAHQCGVGKNNFNDRPPKTGSSSDSCPVKATMDCIEPLKTVSKIDQDSCIAMAKAKNCFVDKLYDCGGSEEEQLAVDIDLAGMEHHIQKCKEMKISFSKEGDICVPNPLDVYVPLDLKQRIFSVTKEEAQREKFLKQNCRPLEEVGEKLDKFEEECSGKVTVHVANGVSQALMQLNGPRLRCMKKGYNVDCSGNSGSSFQGRLGLMITSTAFIGVIVQFLLP